jgi:thioredoxin-related protein
MKSTTRPFLFGIAVLAVFGVAAAAALPLKKTGTAAQPKGARAETAIQWITWDEAIKASAKQPKKIFVDVYTDWCGWCKQMDKTTFADPKVVEAVNKHFYAVKLDAEGKDEIAYGGKTFKFIASGARGVHELAYALLDGRLGYPSYVYLNEAQERITISPGYKPTESFLKELDFITGEHYKTTSYDVFMRK